MLTLFILAMLSDNTLSAEVEQLALTQRRAIRTMAMDYTVTRTSKSREIVSRCRYFFDGKKQRLDEQELGHADMDSYAAARAIKCINCEQDGWGIEAIDLESFVSKYARLDARTFGKEGLLVADHRVLGYSPNSYTVAYSQQLDNFVANASRKNVRTQPDVLDEIDCVRVDWDGMNGQPNSVWIAPSLGHTVLKLLVQASDKPDSTSSMMVHSTEVKPVGNSGLFYPRRIAWQYTSDTGKILSRDELVVESITINEPIPPVTFTLGGLGLREGTEFMQVEKGKSGVLKGGKIVPYSAAGLDLPPREFPAPIAVDAAGVPIVARTNAWWYAAVVLALATVAVAIYRVKRA